MALSVLPLNRCRHPSWVIASRHFNRNPQPLEIQGARIAHHSFFARMDLIKTPRTRERYFREYMKHVFLAGKWRGGTTYAERRSLRNDYLRFLRGWIHNANSEEGAVLKGWVESRFGLPPVFHSGKIDSPECEEYMVYLGDRMRESARSNAIESQLDLVYEYVQYELARRHPGTLFFQLYRGIRNIHDYLFLEETTDRRAVVRMNNLNSFSGRFEYAWEFGSHVFEANVPAAKIFFRSDLLPGILPEKEEESLVIGGDFDVIVREF
ncbi:MAG: NAD(+)--dinitrogen-reductase ADP-D-ribosyltransferase [Syntrophorhabdaceae bacterium]|nr:NAD(+)--dinitrogen-reductase ADP-D-ribosyltransferase [Syntrophorhabdaceae bacterium]